MAVPRRFDWDEARRLRRETWMTYAELGAHFGVSGSAVRLACDERARQKQAEATRRYQTGSCIDCGGRAGINRSNIRRGRDHGRCKPCSIIAATTSAREGELRCWECREWKPDEEFSRHPGHPGRRFRLGRCKRCDHAARTDRRRRRAMDTATEQV